jgi:hypothetical protein
MAWNGKIQQGSFYSAEEAMEAIKKQAQTEEELTHYSIVTPDKVIHLGKEYAIRYANGGGVEDELYVAEYQKGQWTVKDKKNPSANYTLSSKKENAENVRQALIDSPSKLKYYRNNEYAKGGGVEGDCGCNGGDEYGTGGGVDHECKCDEGGVYNNPFLKSIFGI